MNVTDCKICHTNFSDFSFSSGSLACCFLFCIAAFIFCYICISHQAGIHIFTALGAGITCKCDSRCHWLDCLWISLPHHWWWYILCVVLEEMTAMQTPLLVMLIVVTVLITNVKSSRRSRIFILYCTPSWHQLFWLAPAYNTSPLP